MEIKLTQNAGRLDKFVADYLKDEFDFSRSYVQKLIEEGYITVNTQQVSAKYNLLSGDTVVINPKTPEAISAIPQDVKFEIIYQDSDILVVNKPNGLIVHPAAGNRDQTLVNGLLFHIKDLSSIAGKLRPGIVHRLDKMTTGLLMVAKTDQAHKKLTEMLANNQIYKEYLALVHGELASESGLIDAPIGRHKADRKKMTVTDHNSKPAKTHFEVVKKFEHYTLLKCVLETGRTHQIRVHLSFINHPVVGDPLYAFKEDQKDTFGQYLHAQRLKFKHPITGEKLEFYVEIPREFSDKIRELEK
ncbi:ribosomal large subunit pseudouridylate synthase D [Spiroplasma clarkii]|uniref:Pseudouridine synthase n=1 Tax=Spiroplasma clarkii TaxID=2139 RepID=A0A1Y0L0B8_9MOLU|nr:RluA family pseudouridine synthase [Spiroplasma clarkii]ARU91423.1 ribosomal large subunit pseudouridylate synthase D [Spiroplasma clarkii]ATX70839.1 ribosomal large subunit pseudouridylate synthase D [Spiroplasma clarkii]